MLIYLNIFLHLSCLRDNEIKIRVNNNCPGFKKEINQHRKIQSLKIVNTHKNFFILTWRIFLTAHHPTTACLWRFTGQWITINNPILVLALRLRPAPSAASPCDSAGSQQSRTSLTPHSLPTCDCRDSLHADGPLLKTQQWSMGDHLLTPEALVMKMMGRLPVLLQSSAAQGVRQWHKQTTCWFTCGSHRLPQIHPIEIQITKKKKKNSGRSLILHTKEDARLNTKAQP